MSAVSDAGARADGGADEDPAAEGDGDADAEGDGDGDAEGDADGDAEGEADGEAEGDGDAVGCEDLAAAEAEPTTRWPAGICAEPVVTSVRDPTEGGASAGTGAACPLIPPEATVARVADAGT